MKNKLNDFINLYEKEIILKKGVTQESVNKVFASLGLKENDDLCKYLLEFGAISFRSLEMCGLGYSDNSYRNIIKSTLDARKIYNIPNNSVLLEDLGENSCVIYCFDEGVYYWSNNKKKNKISDHIDEFILIRLNEEL